MWSTDYLQYLLGHFAVTVSAISGVLAAGRKQIDLFGVVVLGLVTAVGGGSVRDIILGAHPVFWIADSSYVLNAVITAALTFYIARHWMVPRAVLDIADAFGLALFTMLGAAKALSFHTGMTDAVVLGVITGAGGGIVRDVLVGEIPFVFRQQIYLYATAAVIGATAFVLLEAVLPGGSTNLLIGAALTLALRLAAIRWKLTLPTFQPPTDDPS